MNFRSEQLTFFKNQKDFKNYIVLREVLAPIKFDFSEDRSLIIKQFSTIKFDVETLF